MLMVPDNSRQNWQLKVQDGKSVSEIVRETLKIEPRMNEGARSLGMCTKTFSVISHLIKVVDNSSVDPVVRSKAELLIKYVDRGGKVKNLKKQARDLYRSTRPVSRRKIRAAKAAAKPLETFRRALFVVRDNCENLKLLSGELGSIDLVTKKKISEELTALMLDVASIGLAFREET